MIVEFSLANYRSFNSLQTISFRATGLTSENKSVDAKNIYDGGPDRILKIAGIYGANASGKSNLLKGLYFFREMIVNSLESEKLARHFVNPFKLTDAPVDNSGFFQIVLVIDKEKYRYGFTLNEDATIQSEWLFGPAAKKETFYFKRTGAELKINDEYFAEGSNLPKDKLRTDALFLTFSASYNGMISRKIKDYFNLRVQSDNHQGVSGIFRNVFRGNLRETDRLIEDGDKEIVLDWMREAGILFQDVTIETIGDEKSIAKKRVKFAKNIYNQEGEVSGLANMDLLGESDGTQKFYSYIGKLNNLFKTGGVFYSDEIDSNFHPSLLQKLIAVFQNKQINTGGAQLLFTSHDTNLMNPEFMRRDQFYFTEKTIFDETVLYSLADLRGIRNNADFARQYLAGLYGAIPQLDNLLEESE